MYDTNSKINLIVNFDFKDSKIVSEIYYKIELHAWSVFGRKTRLTNKWI